MSRTRTWDRVRVRVTIPVCVHWAHCALLGEGRAPRRPLGGEPVGAMRP